VSERARTLFLGSGTFAVPVATAIARHPSLELVGVVAAPERRDASGEPIASPVAEWAKQRQVGAYQPDRLRDPVAIEVVRRATPDLLVLADYGQIVPSPVLDLPKFGALNLHPSLLPRHRGASPIQASILEGDIETGVSLIRMDAGLDTGPLVAQRAVHLTGSETAPELEARLAALAADLLSDTLGPWLAGQIEPTPQADEGATMTRPMKREDGRLEPERGILHLDRQMRAYQPWPGSFIETVAGRVLVWDARPLVAGASRRSGTMIRLPANRLALATSDGMLELIEVQPAGGRRMTGADLLRGRPQLAGSEIIARD
jgi:methionyl-tRNA formyltransferase